MATLHEKDEAGQPLMDEEEVKAHWKNLLRSRRDPHPQAHSLIAVLFATNIVTILVGLVIYSRFTHNAPNSPDRLVNSYTDPWFGEIPYADVLWEEDKRYVDTFPKVFINQSTGDDYSIWSELYPSGWVELNGHGEQELEGGADLTYWGSDDEEWSPGSQAWAVTVMHQIHCLGTMKTSYQMLAAGEYLNEERLGHFPHCIEYLRQAVMCQADMTLEPPFNLTRWPQGTTGWGNTHRCKNWDAVVNAIKERAIVHGDGKWIRVVPHKD